MKKKSFVIFFLLLITLINAQNTDPKFSSKKEDKKNDFISDRIKIIHADIAQKNQKKFNGNTFFVGNVHLEHQGSTLKADTIVLYSEENFARAIGNTQLTTADGNIITAGEIEYNGNTQRGIARKNVMLTDSEQTIKTEVLYYDKISNTAYFDKGGTIYSDNNTISTNTATYNISSRTINTSGNVNIDNEHYILEGDKIIQNQNTNIIDFLGPTKIISKETPNNYVYTEEGNYNMNSKEFFLGKNSKIYYNGKMLTANRMYYNQGNGFGKAEGNVILNDPQENRYIRGGYGEVFEAKDSAVISQKPYAVKVFKRDSLYISAEKFLVYRKDNLKTKKSFLRAFNKVRMFKSDFQARADSLSFNETDGELHFIRNPFLWTNEKQVSGDTIKAYFNPNKEGLDSLKVINNAFAISKVDSLNLKDEFHQVKGKIMSVYFRNNDIDNIKVSGNAQAITYAESENPKNKELDRIGILLSTCGEINASFENKKVHIVSCNIEANIDVYPMSKISPERRKFPGFNWNTKDRLRHWKDIFLESPNYEEIYYIPDTELFDKEQDKLKKEEEKNNNKIKREKK